jgi:hypothetical protein
MVNFKDSKGFQIVSVGVEQNEHNWKRAIAKDELRWPYHLMADSNFESPMAKAFNVKQIPTKFLINPDGQIMATDPSLQEVRRLLRDRIQS